MLHEQANDASAHLAVGGTGSCRRPLEHCQGPDWVHPAVALRDYGNEVLGLGLVALAPIPYHSTVILFGGTLMSWSEVQELPHDMRDIPYQVEDDIFFGIKRREDVGIGERINHSCDPNTGFVSEMRLVAIRDIQPGDAITMDYGSCTSKVGYYLECRCGERNCRGAVRHDDWKRPDLRERLGRYFQPYLRRKWLSEIGH